MKRRCLKLLNKEEESKLIRILPDEVEYMIPIWLMKTGKCKVYRNLDSTELEFACISNNINRPDAWIYGSPESKELAEWFASYNQKIDFIGIVSLKEMMLKQVEHEKSDYIDYHILSEKSNQPEFRDSNAPILLGAEHSQLFQKLDEEGKSFFGEWSNINEALEESIIYGVTDSDKLLSFALTLAVTNEFMELGVWTKESYRRRGFSFACSNALIERIFSESKIPVWGTERGNVASMSLAKKLGFKKVHEYYWVTRFERWF